MNVDFSLDNSTAQYHPDNDSFTIEATVTWSTPVKLKGIFSYTINIICVDGFTLIFTLTVDSTTNTVTFTIVVKSYRLYFAVVTATNSVASASANSTEIFSPTGGKLQILFTICTLNPFVPGTTRVRSKTRSVS